MRRGLLMLLALAAALAACGGGEGDYANEPRPATPINVTAAIHADGITLSPKTFGAGPITMIVSNQSGKAQTVTIQTQELGGSQPGIKQSTEPIEARGTATLKADLREGDYSVSVKGRAVQAADLTVKGKRKSAQDQLLEP